MKTVEECSAIATEMARSLLAVTEYPAERICILALLEDTMTASHLTAYLEVNGRLNEAKA